jgi:hypothetical protein
MGERFSVVNVVRVVKTPSVGPIENLANSNIVMLHVGLVFDVGATFPTLARSTLGGFGGLEDCRQGGLQTGGIFAMCDWRVEVNVGCGIDVGEVPPF